LNEPKEKDERMTEYEYDSIGRPWWRCPICGRKSPAWAPSQPNGITPQPKCVWRSRGMCPPRKLETQIQSFKKRAKQ
jgi:hypothetical protein